MLDTHTIAQTEPKSCSNGGETESLTDPAADGHPAPRAAAARDDGANESCGRAMGVRDQSICWAAA